MSPLPYGASLAARNGTYLRERVGGVLDGIGMVAAARWPISRDRKLAPMAVAGVLVRLDGRAVIAQGNLGHAVDAARAVGADHGADLAMDAPVGSLRPRQLAARGGGAFHGVAVEDRHALLVGQADAVAVRGGRGRRRRRLRERR